MDYSTLKKVLFEFSIFLVGNSSLLNNLVEGLGGRLEGIIVVSFIPLDCRQVSWRKWVIFCYVKGQEVRHLIM